VSETCKETVGGPWRFRDCGRPAKGRGDVIGGKDVPLCGIHLAAIKRRADNDANRAQRSAEREASSARLARVAAAERRVIGLAEGWGGAVAREERRIYLMEMETAVADLRAAREAK